MSTLESIIIYTFLGSIAAMVGGGLLLIKKKLPHTISHGLAAFAAGALLGAAFLDLLPEALHESGDDPTIFMWVLGGLLFFFFLERTIHWFHNHTSPTEEKQLKPTIPLIIFGDGVHNFIDGVVIAATVMVDPGLGLVTVLAIAAHEIPQEIGDFGLLLHEGLSKKKAFLYNFLSQLASVAGGILTFFIGASIEGIIPYLIAITAGFFIYIAASDIIPQIHEENQKRFAIVESLLLLLGVLVIYGSGLILAHSH